MRLLEGKIPPLQNDYWFLSSSYLKGTLLHYKMKIGFYMFLSSGYLKGKLQYYKMTIEQIAKYMCFTAGSISGVNLYRLALFSGK